MVLKNYWKWLENTLKFTCYGDNIFNRDIGMIGIDGETCPIALRASVNDDVRNYISPNHCILSELSVVLGSGIEEITVDDYAMSNDITSSISNLNFSYESVATDQVERIVTVTGTNNSGNPITITQIGLCKNIKYLPSAWVSKKVLFVKHQLNEPLTVANHDGFSLVFEWIEQ